MLIGSLITIFVAVTIVVVAFYQPNLKRRRRGGSGHPFLSNSLQPARSADGDGLSGSWIEDRHGAFL
jgi:hypothetical protein